MRLLVLTAVVAVAVLVPATALAAHQNGNLLHAALRGSFEVPKGDPNGSGTVKITLAGVRICWQFQLAGIAKATGARIQRGELGKVGPVVAQLGKTFRLRGCVVAPAVLVASIRRHPRRFYVNVRNERYPRGALRGQLHGS